MPKIDLSRQTNLEIDSDATLLVSGIISITNSGILDLANSQLIIDGQQVLVSADQLNSLSGVTTNVQDQIDLIETALANADHVTNWFNSLTSDEANYVNRRRARISNKNISTGFHTGGTADRPDIWLIFINGQAVPTDAIVSIVNDGSSILVTFDITELGFRLRPSYEITVWGPMVTA